MGFQISELAPAPSRLGAEDLAVGEREGERETEAAATALTLVAGEGGADLIAPRAVLRKPGLECRVLSSG